MSELVPTTVFEPVSVNCLGNRVDMHDCLGHSGVGTFVIGLEDSPPSGGAADTSRSLSEDARQPFTNSGPADFVGLSVDMTGERWGYYVRRHASPPSSGALGWLSLLRRSGQIIGISDVDSFGIGHGTTRLIHAYAGPSRVVTPPTTSEPQPTGMTAIARDIQRLVPEFSESDLAHLVGVTRATWRSWIGGASARRAKRQRALRLRHILEIRQRVDPDTPTSYWLDTPLGPEIDETPAALLAQERDRVVAILAARAPDETLANRLNPMLDAREFIDVARVDEEFRLRREIYAEDSGQGSDDGGGD